MCIVVKGWNVN